MVEDKRASSTELYDIAPMSTRAAEQPSGSTQSPWLPGLILDNLSIFSEKQRRFLRSDEWAPNKLFEEEDGKDAKAEGEMGEMGEEEDRKRSPSVKRDGRPERLTERNVEKVLKDKADGRRESRVSEGHDGKATDIRTNAKRREDNKSGDAEKDVGGGWTFTIRERPMPDPLTSGKKRRKGAEDSEARFEAMAEKNEASLKKQEEDVDSSLALLERLQQTHTAHAPPEKPQKGRSRSRERAGGGGGVSFEEALRRRMQQRDSEMETSRRDASDISFGS
eukprot:Skav205553  [mRNA]  locus=scaffold1061:127914:132708:+ [translate_table: standard]